MDERNGPLMATNAKELELMGTVVRRWEHGVELQRKLMRVMDQIVEARKTYRNTFNPTSQSMLQAQITELQDQERDLHKAIADNRSKT